jgi:hypothetical protein
MTKQLYIHAGLPKTGSTTIQASMKENAVLLQDKAGIYLPPMGSAGPGRLYGELKGESNRPVKSESWDLLGEEISGRDKVLISHERFAALDASVLAAKANAMAETAKVIFYVRRQDELLSSLYAQRAKNGKTFLSADSFIRAKLHRKSYKFSQFFDSWLAAFGRGNVAIGVPNRQFLRNGDLVEDFLGRLEVEESVRLELKPVTSKNVSPCAEILDLCRFLTFKMSEYDKGNLLSKQQLRQDVFRNLNTGLESLQKELGLTKFAADIDLQREILQSYLPDNTELARRYFPAELRDYWEATEPEPRAVNRLMPLPMEPIYALLQERLEFLKENNHLKLYQALGETIDALPTIDNGGRLGADALAANEYMHKA